MIGSILLLSFVTLERVGELWLARANTRRLLRSGGVEHAAGHYPFLVMMHVIWLIGLWLLAWNLSLHGVWLAAFLAVQVLRAWVLASMGTRFTTRIIVVPGERLIDRGLYRVARHPNYWIVVGEIALLPLAFGLWWYALAFSILNAAALAVRIPAEERALSRMRA